MIDWGLVKTMRKTSKTTIKTVIAVVFRVLVAMIISFSISRPMEVKIYAKKLHGQIEKDRQNFIDQEWRNKQKVIKVYDSVAATLAAQDSSIIAQQNRGRDDEIYKILTENYRREQEAYKNIKETNDRLIEDCNANIKRLRNDPTSFYQDTLGVSHMYRNVLNKIGSLNNQISKYRNEIIAQEQKMKKAAQEVIDVDNEYRHSFNDLLGSNKNERQTIIEQRRIKQIEDSIALAQIVKASYIAFDTIHPGLITQLEAMSSYEKTEQGKDVSAVRWILLLIIIGIDTAPIIIKVLTKRGPYDDILEEKEDELIFSSYNETITNKFLIKELSIAQREVLTEAIQKWKEREMADTDIINNYINRNP
jgi:hypothetical protein